MGDPPPLRVDTPSLNWDPADVTVPPVPVIPAGGDPMSVMISAIMPELAAPLTEAVATTHAREERFEANLDGARTAYQSTDQAGEQEIQTVSSQQLAATSSAAPGSAANAGSSSGQLMSTAMQMASQAAQAPAQMMGMAASVPQSIMQGAQGVMQQMGQLSGQFEKPAGENEDKAASAQVEPRDREGDKADASNAETAGDGASPGSSFAEGVPTPEWESPQSTTPQTSPRVDRTDGLDPIDL